MALGPLVTGFRATAGTQGIEQTQRKVDMAQKILLLEPESSPLVVISKSLSSRRCFNPKFQWLEKELDPRFDTINNVGGYVAGATALIVTNAAYWEVGNLAYVTRTGETMRVTAVNTGTQTLTVIRGVGSTAAALNQGDELLIAGVSQQEGDTSRTARSRNPLPQLNYTQIFREPWAVTNTTLYSEFEADDDWQRQAADHGIEHAKNIEYALMVGHPSEDTTNFSQPNRTTGGYAHFVATNITDAAGTLTELGFYTGLRPMFRYGAKEKVGFASMLAVDVLNTFPRGKIQITNPDQNKYGLKVMQFVSPHGTLNLVTHYLLEGTTLGKQLWVLDPNNLQYRYLQNARGSRDTHVVTNIQETDRDGRKDEYLTECGLQFGLEKTHGKFINIG